MYLFCFVKYLAYTQQNLRISWQASETPGATLPTRIPHKTAMLATMESRYPKTTSWTRPDKDATDAAIADFFKRLEAQEQEFYAGLHGALSHLPVPGKVDPKGLSVHAALEAGMLPHMDDEEALRFTPSQVLLYLNAQDQRYV